MSVIFQQPSWEQLETVFRVQSLSSVEFRGTRRDFRGRCPWGSVYGVGFRDTKLKEEVL